MKPVCADACGVAAVLRSPLCVLLLWCCCLLSGCARITERQALENVESLLDASTTLTVDDARRRGDWADASRTENPRYTTDALWLRGRIDWPAGARKPVLEIGPATLNEIDLWLYAEDGRLIAHLQDGDERPALHRYLDNRLPLLQLPLESGHRYEAVLRFAGDGSLTPRIRLWREEDFLVAERTYQLLYGGLHGVLLAMALYYFFLAFGAKLAQYQRYTIFTLAVSVVVASTSGMGQQYLWGDFAWARTHMTSLAPNVADLSALFFIIAYLELRRNSPRIYLQIRGFMVISTVLVLASLVFSEGEVMPWVNRASLLLAIWGVIAPIYLAWRGLRQAYFFLAAWAPLLAASLALALVPFGLLPANGFAEHAENIGFLLETLVLSIGLADLFNQERTSRERATQQSLALSEELQKKTQAMLELQREANESLERKVAERTERLEDTLHELEAANRKLESLSVTDPLTGLYNRRHLEAVLDREMARSRRNKREAALLAMDVDHFKSVNDRFGHLIGDQCLQAVAEVVKASCRRRGDMAVRFGGEEFVAYYPATDRHGAIAMARRILRDVRSLVLHDAAGNEFRTTISIGIALDLPEASPDAEELITLADTALYAAKHAGRDRAVIAGDDEDALAVV